MKIRPSFGDINRGEWPERFHPKSSAIFSYAMNNYWHTNYRARQGGSVTFSYVMTSAEQLDSVALSRLGWGSMEAPALDLFTNGQSRQFGRAAARRGDKFPRSQLSESRAC
jgi:hypothetical protein